MMPAKRRGMADFIAQQRELIEDPIAGDQRPGLAAVPEPAPAVAAPPSAITAAAVPEPHSPTGHGQLSPAEESDLATCEAALHNLRLAFWAAGKALAVIQSARLYRGAFDTFEEYVETRWEMSRAQAYRLISAWPLAERLSPIGDTLTESHVRELLQLAGQHGPDAAELVYQTVADADGVRVTAAVLKGVVGILPADYFDRDEVVQQIRDYLANGQVPTAPPPADPVQRFTTETDRILKSLRGDIAKAAYTADPGKVREAIASVRARLDEIEREATA
jgi:hypothetical protein